MKIICSAIKMSDGTIIRGHRHHDCIRTARDIPRLKEMQIFEQGFMNSDNEFVERGLARRIEEKRRQDENDGKKSFQHDTLLFSEDLY
jgi:hypothetical protein